jgi:hypothetical protein
MLKNVFIFFKIVKSRVEMQRRPLKCGTSRHSTGISDVNMYRLVQLKHCSVDMSRSRKAPVAQTINLRCSSGPCGVDTSRCRATQAPVEETHPGAAQPQ